MHALLSELMIGVVWLQIKGEDGKQVFIVKLRFTATIADVRKCLDKQR